MLNSNRKLIAQLIFSNCLTYLFATVHTIFFYREYDYFGNVLEYENDGEGRGGEGRGGEGRDGMGWDGKGWEGMGWDGMGWDGMGWEGKGREGKGREGKGREGKGASNYTAPRFKSCGAMSNFGKFVSIYITLVFSAV